MRIPTRAAAVTFSGALALLAACSDQGAAPGRAPAPTVALAAPADPAAAKQLLLDFFGFQGTRQERADQVMTADYVQHNPRFLRMDALTGATGSQAWVAAGERAGEMRIRLVALGGIRLRDPIVLMAEGDLVTAIYRGRLARPDDPTRTYEAYAFETFRVRDGRVSEHWDQVRLESGWMEAGVEPAPVAVPQPEPVAQPDPRPGCAVDAAGAETAKALAAIASGAGAGQAARLAVLADGFASHSPSIAQRAEVDALGSREAFVEAMAAGLTGGGEGALAPRVADLVTAECDYVTVVWRRATADPDDTSRTYESFTFDTFRVEGNRLVEHWDSSTLSQAQALR
jgi:predicted SnoaL-like aldol condensation-catalyzing enzyme